jgi:hypothetical protein
MPPKKKKRTNLLGGVGVFLAYVSKYLHIVSSFFPLPTNGDILYSVISTFFFFSVPYLGRYVKGKFVSNFICLLLMDI